MSNLDAWMAQNIFEADLPSGVHVKGQFVDMEQILLTGTFDVRVLAELDQQQRAEAETTEEAAPVDPAQIAEGLRYRRAVVCSCLKEVDGEAIELTDEQYHSLPSDDRDQFFNYAARIVEVPKAEG